MERVAGELQAPRHGAQFVEEWGELLVQSRAALDALPNELQSLVQQLDLAKRVVERATETA